MCKREDNQLKWEVTGTKRLLHTQVFDVLEQAEVSATGIKGDYVALEAPDWVMVIPEVRGSFVLVRQWRHAAGVLSLEFPGGVADKGESPATVAARELREETGFKAGKLTCLGVLYPNPALFQNRFHVYLAQALTPAGGQELDDDELLTFELRPIDEVIAAYGSGELTHALMGTALMLYLRCRDGNARA